MHLSFLIFLSALAIRMRSFAKGRLGIEATERFAQDNSLIEVAPDHPKQINKSSQLIVLNSYIF